MIADPHCHTVASDGMVTPAELVAAASAARVDLIAVTDHDTMASVRETKERGAAAGLTIVAGQEITTRWPAQTHVMGWFLDTPVKRGMSVEDTVAAIHDQGGLAIVPHPFIPVYFGAIQPEMLRRLLEKTRVDGMETMFTAPLGPWRRRQLEVFIAEHAARLGARVGGSDCHFGAHDIGSVVTRYDGDFRIAIEQRTTVPVRMRRGVVPARIVLRQQWRSMVELPLRRVRGQLE